MCLSESALEPFLSGGQLVKEGFFQKIAPWLWWLEGGLETVFVTVFMCWNLGFPATAPVIFIGPKRKHRGKDYQKAIDSKVYPCSDIDLGQVLFRHV